MSVKDIIREVRCRFTVIRKVITTKDYAFFTIEKEDFFGGRGGVIVMSKGAAYDQDFHYSLSELGRRRASTLQRAKAHRELFTFNLN